MKTRKCMNRFIEDAVVRFAHWITSSLVLLAAMTTTAFGGFILNVDAKSDLSNAGRSEVRSPFTPPDLVLLPVGVNLSPGTGRRIEFSEVTGTVSAGPGWPDVGPDGGTVGIGPTYGTNIFSYNGVSGIVANRFLFLTGVFLTDDQPVEGAAPDRLDFRTIGTEFHVLAPLINQSFFIGDGRTTAGESQQFQVPEGATRLYLGFLDSYNFGWTQDGDLPYAYWDNTGSLTATFTVNAVPEPSTFVLASIAGAATIFLRAFRRLVRCREAA
jgi:hypothetical protein